MLKERYLLKKAAAQTVLLAANMPRYIAENPQKKSPEKGCLFGLAAPFLAPRVSFFKGRIEICNAWVSYIVTAFHLDGLAIDEFRFI